MPLCLVHCRKHHFWTFAALALGIDHQRPFHTTPRRPHCVCELCGVILINYILSDPCKSFSDTLKKTMGISWANTTLLLLITKNWAIFFGCQIIPSHARNTQSDRACLSVSSLAHVGKALRKHATLRVSFLNWCLCFVAAHIPDNSIQ